MSELEAYDWSTQDWSKGPALRAKFLKFQLWQWDSTTLGVCDTKDKQDGDPMDVDGAQGNEIPSFSPPRWIDAIKQDGVDVDQLYKRYYIKFGGKFCVFIFCFEGGEMMWLMKSAFNTAAGPGSADKFIHKGIELMVGVPKANGVGNKDRRIQDAKGETVDNAVDLTTPSPSPRRGLHAKTIKKYPEPATRQRRGSTPENDRGTQIPPVYESIESPSKSIVRQTEETTQPNEGRYGKTPSRPPLQEVKGQTRPATDDDLDIEEVIYNRVTRGSKTVVLGIVRRKNGTHDIVQLDQLYDKVVVEDSSRTLAPVADRAFVNALMTKHEIKLDMKDFECVGCVGYYPGKNQSGEPWRLVMLKVKNTDYKIMLQDERKGRGNYDGPLLVPISVFRKSFKVSVVMELTVKTLYLKTEFAKSVSAKGHNPLRHGTVPPDEDEKIEREDARISMQKRMEERMAERMAERMEEMIEKSMNQMTKRFEEVIKRVISNGNGNMISVR
jgi:hypothetical protein